MSCIWLTCGSREEGQHVFHLSVRTLRLALTCCNDAVAARHGMRTRRHVLSCFQLILCAVCQLYSDSFLDNGVCAEYIVLVINYTRGHVLTAVQRARVTRQVVEITLRTLQCSLTARWPCIARDCALTSRWASAVTSAAQIAVITLGLVSAQRFPAASLMAVTDSDRFKTDSIMHACFNSC
jgi:hypothetical protein